ncbi:hypothetical protein PQX77_007439 [Marasmius sp. AFHP31]|nr:hypothetical protein PQX77_007439 [Marasmius sp. AFHP31]
MAQLDTLPPPAPPRVNVPRSSSPPAAEENAASTPTAGIELIVTHLDSSSLNSAVNHFKREYGNVVDAAKAAGYQGFLPTLERLQITSGSTSTRNTNFVYVGLKTNEPRPDILVNILDALSLHGMFHGLWKTGPGYDWARRVFVNVNGDADYDRVKPLIEQELQRQGIPVLHTYKSFGSSVGTHIGLDLRNRSDIEKLDKSPIHVDR